MDFHFIFLQSIAGLDGEGLDPRQPDELEVPEYTKLVSIYIREFAFSTNIHRNHHHAFQLTGDIKGLRIGLLKEGFNPEFEPDVNDLVRKSAERLCGIGAVVEEVSIPWHSIGRFVFYHKDTTMVDKVVAQLLHNAYYLHSH